MITKRINQGGMILIFIGIVLPFIFLKDYYPFHRFGMFAEPIHSSSQQEHFYIFYQDQKLEWTLLTPHQISVNTNAFDMQVRKYHYQKHHQVFIQVIDSLIRQKYQQKILHWKWYHVIQEDSICVFSSY